MSILKLWYQKRSRIISIDLSWLLILDEPYRQTVKKPKVDLRAFGIALDDDLVHGNKFYFMLSEKTKLKPKQTKTAPKMTLKS